MKIIFILVIIILLTGCYQRPSINNIASNIATRNDWQEYTYKIEREDDSYTIIYLHGGKETRYTVTFDKNNDYIAEVVK